MKNIYYFHFKDVEGLKNQIKELDPDAEIEEYAWGLEIRSEKYLDLNLQKMGLTHKIKKMVKK